MYIATKLLYCIFLAFSLVEFSVSDQSQDGWGEVHDIFGEWETLAPTTSTTPAPVTPELLCEMKYDKSNKSFVVHQDIQDLMGQYNNWGKLLAPAPVTIGILGQLILMANEKMDFPINSEDPQKVYKHIEYPNSFRTTLLQISQRGYRTFLKAHTNMNAIRNLNRVVPNDIKDAVKYLISKNMKVIELRLPATLKKIEEAFKTSQDLSKEVAKEFSMTLSLIEEVELAVSSTRRGAESRLEDAILDIKLKQQEKELSEKEELILKEKDVKMKAMVLKLEHRKGHLYHKTTYGIIEFIINLAKENWESEIVKEIGQEQYNKDKNFLNDKNRTWSFTFYKNFVISNPCAQENSQSLLDLLIAFGEYRETYEHWQKSNNNQKNSVFNGTKVIENFERILGTLQQCPDVEDIKTKGFDLLKKLQNTTTFQSDDKTTKRPCSNEIDDIIILIDNLRKAANKVAEKSKQEDDEIVINSSWDIYRISKQHQLNQLINMSKTMEDIIRLNNDLTEIRRQKSQQILDRIASLDVNKVQISEVIRALKLGLTELGILKDDWGKLIEFFENVYNFIQLASRHSTGLVEIVNTLSKYHEDTFKDRILFKDLLNNVEKSNEAVLLVHGIADIYTKVSDLYIMGRVARLNTMNSMLTGNLTKEELQQEKETLSKDTKQASEGIESFFIHQSVQLNETLKTRHQEIFTEYQQLLTCLKDNGLIDRAINFTGSDWFQLKSRTTGKMLDVSLGNNSTVQMWDSHDKDNQLWYLDQDKIIRSFATDGCLTSQDNPRTVNIEPCNTTTNQKWTLKDNVIINVEDSKRCLEIHDLVKNNGVHIVEKKCNRSPFQIWDIIRNGQNTNSKSENWFQLRSRLNGKVLDLSFEKNPNVHMWDPYGEINQLWYLDEDKIIRSAVNDDCITSQGYGELVTIEICNNTENQKWTFKDNVIVNLEDTDHCLDIFHAAEHNGAHLCEYRFHRGRSHQIWDIVPNGQTVTTKSEKWFQLKSRLSGKVLDFSCELLSSNLYLSDPISKMCQLWYLDQEKIIRSVVNDNCLTTHGYSPAITTVEHCKNMKNQKWTLKHNAIVNFEDPNRCLSIHQFNKSSRAHIVEYNCHRSPNQIWDIVQNGQNTNSKIENWFQLRSRLNGKVLDLSFEKNPNVHMWDPYGEINQLWYLDEDKIIRSAVNDDCITSQGNNKLVTIELCNNTKNQKWTFKDNVIVNLEDTGHCLDIFHAAEHNGAHLGEYRCHRGAHQIWDIVPNGLTVSTKSENWFQLKSRLNGKVLDFSCGLFSSNLHMSDPISRMCQLWYLDQEKIIRSVVNDDCLTTHGYSPAIATVELCKNIKNQKWTLKHNTIVNLEDPNRCLSIHHFNKSNGAHIVEYNCHRCANQMWDIVQNGQTATTKRENLFQIKSQMDGNLLNFLCGHNPNVCVFRPHSEIEQLWYLDQDKIIRAAVNDDCLTSHGYDFASVTLEICKNTTNQKWILKDDAIVNAEDSNRCVYLHHFVKENAIRIIEHNCSRDSNHLWGIIH